MQIFEVKGGDNRRGLRFKFLTGDVYWQGYGGVFVSTRLNNGEFDYWLVIEVANMDEACGEKGYCVSLKSIAPSEVAPEEMRRALAGFGYDDPVMLSDAMIDWLKTDLAKVEILNGYGIFALLWEEVGTNLRKLMKEARTQANATQLLYGAYMDAPQNAIGTTGWEMQRGDTLAGLRRYREEREAQDEIQDEIQDPNKELILVIHKNTMEGADD